MTADKNSDNDPAQAPRQSMAVLLAEENLRNVRDAAMQSSIQSQLAVADAERVLADAHIASANNS